MSESRQTLIDVLKAIGFVLAGTLGVVALAAFFQGFRAGYEGAAPSEAPGVEQAASDDADG